jgi:hypothetical protein
VSTVSSDGQAYFPASQQFDTPATEGIELNEPGNTHDWSKSFHGLSTQPFAPEVAEILMQPVTADDIEIKPGINSHYLQQQLIHLQQSLIYHCEHFLLHARWPSLPSRDKIPTHFEQGIWPRRMGFGPKRGAFHFSQERITRVRFNMPRKVNFVFLMISVNELHLMIWYFVYRFVSQARGEQDFFDNSGLPTASEGCKSNALMRCCKDLGIASELWYVLYQ